MITLLVIVLFCGIKCMIAYNYAVHSLVVRVVILGKWCIVTFTIFRANNALYFTINNGFPRSLSIPKKKPKVKFEFPNIKLYDVNVHIALASDDIAGTSIIAGVLNILFAYLKGQNKVIFSNLKQKIDIKQSTFDVKFIVEFTIKYSLLKIIFAYLHMIARRGYYRRKYGRQDRRTDGVHTR